MPGKGKSKDKQRGSGQYSGRDTHSDRYAATTWGRPGVFDVTVPSGQLVQVQRLGPTQLVKSGLLAKVDILSAIVESEHIDRVSGRNEDFGAKLTKAQKAAKAEEDRKAQIRKLSESPDQLLEAMNMMDEITCLVVLQPKIYMPPVPHAPTPEDYAESPDLEVDDEGLWLPERRPERIYVDSVDVDDKVFLFQYVMGGSDDLKSFRQKLDEGMAALESEQDVSLPTE